MKEQLEYYKNMVERVYLWTITNECYVGASAYEWVANVEVKESGNEYAGLFSGSENIMLLDSKSSKFLEVWLNVHTQQ